jgi:hypothetical protein
MLVEARREARTVKVAAALSITRHFDAAAVARGAVAGAGPALSSKGGGEDGGGGGRVPSWRWQLQRAAWRGRSACSAPPGSWARRRRRFIAWDTGQRGNGPRPAPAAAAAAASGSRARPGSTAKNCGNEQTLPRAVGWPELPGLA